ncbi:MAG: TIGR02281 family clan AA aspartic protease [Gammaproteobacteria bacterium]|nr:TIGR02281 family clan AA aspartic protease [Gammaproteobacteria bacterium]
MASRKQILGVMLFSGLMLMMNVAGAVESITLMALFKDKAILVVDGARRVLNSGEESPEGVKLLSTDTQEEKAVIEIGGKSETLKLGVVIAQFTAKGRNSVTLYPDSRNHFFTEGWINGVAVRFLVDTGASSVAMGSDTAKRVGLDYKNQGLRGYSNTAAGVVPSYRIKLDKVQVGEIAIYNVDGGVTESMDSGDVLLGMSFLGRLDMRQDDGKLELHER